MKSDFLENVRTPIELLRVPMTMLYDNALVTYRNEVDSKYPFEGNITRLTTGGVNGTVTAVIGRSVSCDGGVGGGEISRQGQYKQDNMNIVSYITEKK